MDENPYTPPKSESTSVSRVAARSRIWWFVVPAVIGVFAGANLLAGAFGTSLGDPFGTARPSGAGGFVGLAVGAVLHRLTRPQR